MTDEEYFDKIQTIIKKANKEIKRYDPKKMPKAALSLLAIALMNDLLKAVEI